MNLMTLSQAEQILVDFSNDLESYHECLAELGSSAFYGGAQGNGGYDAMSIARQQLGDPPAEDAVIEEARAVCNMFADLELYERDDLLRASWANFIPEFRQPTDRIPF